jgi:hypothetical protein
MNLDAGFVHQRKILVPGTRDGRGEKRDSRDGKKAHGHRFHYGCFVLHLDHNTPLTG